MSAALRGVTLRGDTVTPLWLRVPLQILFIAVTWWTAIQRPATVTVEGMESGS